MAGQLWLQLKKWEWEMPCVIWLWLSAINLSLHAYVWSQKVNFSIHLHYWDYSGFESRLDIQLKLWWLLFWYASYVFKFLYVFAKSIDGIRILKKIWSDALLINGLLPYNEFIRYVVSPIYENEWCYLH